MHNIIVTGATSMIGVAIVEDAIQNEKIGNIIAIIRPNSDRLDRIPRSNKVIVIEVDLDEYEKIPEILEKKGIQHSFSIFYHLAWSRTPTYSESYSDMLLKCKSIIGVLKAVNVAKTINCSRFVYIGGQAEYGIVKSDYIKPDTICNPVRADGISHYAAGKMAHILCSQYSITFIWVRVFSVYGINDRPNSMISSTIKKMMNNEKCQFTKAEQIWDYLYARDLGQAILLAGLKAKKDKIYCVGSGDAKPLKEYIEIIKQVVNPKMEIVFGELPYPDNPVMRLCPDISEFVKDTGWGPQTSFRDGIKEIYEHELKKKQD